jgi:hypothetical protein
MRTINTLLFFLLYIAVINAQNPPRLLQASLVDSTNVLLNWNAPFGGELTELSWSTGIASSAIGMSSGSTFAIASRWEPSQIAAYDGFILHQFSFYQTSASSVHTLKIWSGPEATLAYTQPITNIQENGWNVVPINNTILLDVTKEFWIGIEITQPDNEFPASVDSGPAVAGYGDKINFQGSWENLSFFGIDANFCLKLTLHNAFGNTVVLDAIANEPTAYQSTGFIQIMSLSPVDDSGLDTRAAQSIPDEFRIYRNQNLLATTTDLTWLDADLSPGSYNYAVTAVYGGNESAATTSGIQVGTAPFFIQPEQFVDSFPFNEVFSRTITFFNSSNAPLSWQAVTTSPYIATYPFEGLIAAGGNQEITVTFYTYGFNVGSYQRFINFTTSDSAFSSYSYPMQFRIFSQPQIYLYQTSLEFGNISIGQTAAKELLIYNGGSDTLRLNNISTDNPAFSSIYANISIPPYYQQAVVVKFFPEAIQPYVGNLNFNVNTGGSNSYSIPLTGNGILQPPLYLNAQIENDNDVQLEWLATTSGEGSWIKYCSESYNTSVGLSVEGTYQMAARWPAGTLAGFSGLPLIKTAFYPTSQTTAFTLKIWQGPQASTLLHSQQVTSFQSDQWNEIALDSQVIFDINQDLWIGFELIQPMNEYPAALSDGPSLPELGDMINIGDGWQSLTTYGLPYNWMIKGFIASSPSSLPEALPQPETALRHEIIGSLKSKIIESAVRGGQKNSLTNPVFQGYNLYRNGELLNSALLQESSYTDQNVSNGIYTYGVTSVYDIGESYAVQRLVQIGGPELIVNPSSISDTLEYGTDKSYTLSFTNAGDSNLSWSFLELPYYMTVSGDSANLLPPGQMTNVTLTVLTQYLYPGTFLSPLRILTNNINDSLYIIQTEIKIEGGDILLGFQYDTLDFGLVNANQYVQKQMTVTNLSDYPVYLYAYTDFANFSPFLGIPYLMPGQTTEVIVGFSASQAGTYNSELYFETYAGNEMSLFSIPMKAEIGFPPPSAFTAQVSDQTVDLSWYPPGINPGVLQYGNGETYSSVGFSGSGTLVAAIKFSPAELIAYTGKQLTSVEFYTWSSLPVFKARIYTGPNAENLIFEQLLSNPSANGWNVVQLSNPIPIFADEYLWIGYEMIQSGFDFPAGIDSGPAIEGKGDLISINGTDWKTLSFYGLPYNWNIRGMLSDIRSSNNRPLVLEKIQRAAEDADIFPVLNSENTGKSSAISGNLLGYNLFRDDQKINDVILTDLTFNDTPGYTGTISYAVTAVYDIGESLPATLSLQINPPVNLPEGWNFTKTSFVHNIYIPEASLNRNIALEYGDMFGVFYIVNGEARCAGAAMYTNGQLVLQAYGDDPLTTHKDGFYEGDYIFWKFHKHDADISYNMNVTYDNTMPDHDGIFRNLGISMLATMETGLVGNEETDPFSMISLYPNPAFGDAYISGLETGMLLTVTDMAGRTIRKFNANAPTERISFETSGFYIIEINHNGKLWRKKIIVSR